MNRRRITENTEPAGGTILRSILIGIGLGVGFLIVNKVGEKLEKKYGKS